MMSIGVWAVAGVALPTPAAGGATVGAVPTVAVEAVDISFMALFGHADLVGRLVILSLVLASIAAWTVIINRWIQIRAVTDQSEKFEKLFWSGQLLDQLYERMRTRADHPMAMVFVAAMDEWSRAAQSELNYADSSLRVGIKERIFQAMQVARNRALESTARHVTFLATVGSSAPFIGLFGTVWGIMRSFQSIAASKNTTLAVVAPGIAEALLATAIGLVAAIPAVIFYNKFSSDIQRIAGKIDDFSTELASLLSRELDKAGKV